jgi:hypothetical protein
MTSRGLQPNVDAAAIIDIGATGGHAPDDIFGSQYRCHGTLTAGVRKQCNCCC